MGGPPAVGYLIEGYLIGHYLSQADPIRECPAGGCFIECQPIRGYSVGGHPTGCYFTGSYSIGSYYTRGYSTGVQPYKGLGSEHCSSGILCKCCSRTAETRAIHSKNQHCQGHKCDGNEGRSRQKDYHVLVKACQVQMGSYMRWYAELHGIRQVAVTGRVSIIARLTNSLAMPQHISYHFC